MIAYLNGLIIDKDERSAIVLAQNVGYKVHITTDLASKINTDEKIQIFIHTSVREDDISLFGFQKKEELKFFEQLISVSGIGPKMAMEILSSPIHMTKQAILSGDTVLLIRIKGLGKKTAERLILELKNKIEPADLPSASSQVPQDQDAIEALVSLGYEKYHVIKTLDAMPKNIKDTEQVIKYFLKTG